MTLKSKFWNKKKVLITGCTGFSGSWLVVFLHLLKSKIVGYSLKAPSEPNLFNILKLKNKIKLYNGDINNYSSLKKIILKEKPDIVLQAGNDLSNMNSRSSYPGSFVGLFLLSNRSFKYVYNLLSPYEVSYVRSYASHTSALRNSP